MLSVIAEVEIKELPATELVSRDIYGDDGEIIGQISEEEYQQEMREHEGRAFFGIVVKIGDKHIRIHSAISSPVAETQHSERAHMLSNGLAQIGASIYQNFSEA